MADTILIRGGGDLASGVALRLFRAGIRLVVTEIAQPLAVRRLVSFAEAVYSNRVRIEEVVVQKTESFEDILDCLESNVVPVIVDPEAQIRNALRPLVVIDGRMMKKPPEHDLSYAPFIIGLGPGFEAGKNCHAVVETKRGPFLGRVYWEGSAEEDTGTPETVGRYQTERVIRSPGNGFFQARTQIGAAVKKGEILAEVDGQQVRAHFDGMVRGLLHDGLAVHKGIKVGDLDPRQDPSLPSMVSDKALAVGGGVLEAMLSRPSIRSQLW
jgi:xanthine dehydrogenase accessory factor